MIANYHTHTKRCRHAHNPDFLKDPNVELKIAPFLEGLDISFMEKLPLTYCK